MEISKRAFLAGMSGTVALMNGAVASEDKFYSGATIRLLVGTTPGAGYDLMARHLAAHLGQYIPGNPRVVVENMPGAGSLTMMNFLANRAPKDGSVFGLPLNGVILEPTLKLLSRTGGATNFNVLELNWIGSTSSEAQVLWFMASSKVRDLTSLRSIPSTVGASSPGADNFSVALLANKLLGAKLNIVKGYAGTQPIFLAAERGEIEGSATTYGAIQVARGDWLREQKIRTLVQFGEKRIPDLANVPTAIELTDDEEAKQMLSFFAIKFKAAYPFVMPPNVPAGRVAAVRSAFRATMKDAAFIDIVKRSGLGLDPVFGEELTELVRATYRVPTGIVDKLRSTIEAE